MYLISTALRETIILSFPHPVLLSLSPYFWSEVTMLTVSALVPPCFLMIVDQGPLDTQSIDEIRDDISVLTSDDGSWPDMPVLDSDSCPSIKVISRPLHVWSCD